MLRAVGSVNAMRSVATGRGFTISVAASARSSARALPLTLYELLLLKQSLLLQVLCTHKSLREVERSANLLPGEAPLRALPCAASSDVSMD